MIEQRNFYAIVRKFEISELINDERYDAFDEEQKRISNDYLKKNPHALINTYIQHEADKNQYSVSADIYGTVDEFLGKQTTNKLTNQPASQRTHFSLSPFITSPSPQKSAFSTPCSPCSGWCFPSASSSLSSGTSSSSWYIQIDRRHLLMIDCGLFPALLSFSSSLTRRT